MLINIYHVCLRLFDLSNKSEHLGSAMIHKIDTISARILNHTATAKKKPTSFIKVLIWTSEEIETAHQKLDKKIV